MFWIRLCCLQKNEALIFLKRVLHLAVQALTFPMLYTAMRFIARMWVIFSVSCRIAKGNESLLTSIKIFSVKKVSLKKLYITYVCPHRNNKKRWVFSTCKIFFSTKAKTCWSSVETSTKMYSTSSRSWKFFLQKNRNAAKKKSKNKLYCENK